MSLAYSPDGGEVAIGYLNGIIECFELKQAGDKVSAVGRRMVIDAHNGSVVSLQYVTGELLASSGSDGLVKLWDITSGPLRRQHINTPRLAEMEWSPDGKLLACLSENRLDFIDESGETVSGCEFEDRPRAMAWSPSGDRVVVSLSSQKLEVVDRRGAAIATIPQEGAAVACAPGGNVVAAINGKQLRLFDTHGGGEVLAEFPVENGRAIAFSRDGRLMAYGGGFGAIIVKDRHSNRDNFQFPCESSTVECLLFNSDDSLLASGHGDGMIRIWDLHRGLLKTELAGHEQMATGLAFSPDGRSLLSGSVKDGTLRIWSTEHNRGYGMVRQYSRPETVVNRPDLIRHFSLSADGRRLAVACQDADGNFEVLTWKLGARSLDRQR
jgi:WD40 repeat protein